MPPSNARPRCSPPIAFSGEWHDAQWPARRRASCRGSIARTARVGLIRAFAQEQHVPERDQRPEVQRKDQVVGGRRRMYRLTRHQVRIRGSDVVVRHLREMDVRKRRVQRLAVTPDAGAQCTGERVARPAADAGFRIRRDVGRIDRAERRRERQAARERLAVLRRVTYDAVAQRDDARAARTSCGSNDAGAGGSIGAIDGRTMMPIATAQAAIAMPAAPIQSRLCFMRAPGEVVRRK